MKTSGIKRYITFLLLIMVMVVAIFNSSPLTVNAKPKVKVGTVMIGKWKKVMPVIVGCDYIIRWKKVPGASGYQYVLYEAEENGELDDYCVIGLTNKCKGEEAFSDGVYRFAVKVRAYKKIHGKRIYGKWSKLVIKTMTDKEWAAWN